MGEILTDRSTPVLIGAIEANMVEHFASFGRLPNAEAYDGPDLSWVVTGVPHPVLNGVWRTALPPDTVDAKIEEMVRRCQARRAPLRWVTAPSTRPADLASRLARYGITYTRDWVGMAADLRALKAPPAPPGLTVEEVVDREGLTAWIGALCGGNDFEAFVGAAFFDLFTGMGFGRGLPVRHYLGRLEGEPVATTTLVVAAGVAGIYWVATVPQARRRGVAAALVSAALQDARAAGYRFAVLHSTQMGQNVYRQLGFEPLCTLGLHVRREP